MIGDVPKREGELTPFEGESRPDSLTPFEPEAQPLEAVEPQAVAGQEVAPAPETETSFDLEAEQSKIEAGKRDLERLKALSDQAFGDYATYKRTLEAAHMLQGQRKSASEGAQLSLDLALAIEKKRDEVIARQQEATRRIMDGGAKERERQEIERKKGILNNIERI